MKKKTKALIALLSALCLSVGVATFASCSKKDDPNPDHTQHVDVDKDGKCDECGADLTIPNPAVTCVVTFETNGGSAVAQQAVKGGEKITLPAAPTRYAYNFVGWYKDKNCTQKWDFDKDVVSGESLTLYALWDIKDATEDTYFQFTQNEDESYTIALKPGQTLPLDVVLPSVYEEKAVTAIKENAFEGSAQIKSVYIPATIKNIGTRAFRNCTALEYVQAGENVEQIGSNAFYGTAWDSALTVGDVYIGKCYYKYAGAMYEDTEITVKDGTVGVAERAFSGCSKLVKVTLPNTLKYIGANAFGGNQATDGTGLTEIVLPDSVETIGEGAFRNSSKLASANIGSGMKSVGSRAFANTAISSLTYNAHAELGEDIFSGVTVEGTLTIGDDIEELPMGLLGGWDGLVSVHCGAGITSLPAAAFNGLSKLKEIVADNVEFIGATAFSGTAITEFTISEKVKSIGMNAFKDCTALKTVYYNATEVADLGSGSKLFEGCTALERVVLGDNLTSVPAYLFYGVSAEDAFTVVFGKNITTIEAYAFSQSAVNTGNALEFVVPNSVKHIAERALYQSLYTSLTVGEGVEDIDTWGFGAMDELTSLRWNAVAGYSATVTNYNNGHGILTTSTKLSSIIFGNKVEDIPHRLYNPSSNNEALTEITIPASVHHIGMYAFQKCVNLATVNGIENVANIARTALSDTKYFAEHMLTDSSSGLILLHNNDSLFGYAKTDDDPGDTLTIPEGIKYICDGAFGSSGKYGYTGGVLTNVKTIVFNEGLEEIGDYAFQGCTAVTSKIVLPATVKRVGRYAFYNLTKATGLDITKATNLEYIGMNAFYSVASSGGASVENFTLTLPASIKYLGNAAFQRVASITAIDLTNTTLTEIGENTFNGTKPTSIKLPATCTKVGNTWCTLSECTELIAPALVEVGEYGFATLNANFNFSQIKKFGANALQGITAKEITISADEIGEELFGSLNVNNGQIQLYASTPLLEKVAFTGNITAIGKYSFAACTGLKTVILPASCKTIAEYAFWGCGSLESIDLSHVTKIGEFAFAGGALKNNGGNYPAALKHVTFSEDLEELGANCFDACHLEGELVLGSKLKSIPVKAFTANDLTKVTIKGNIETIEANAFQNCASLKEVILEEGVKHVNGFTGLASGCTLTLPSTVEDIGTATVSTIKLNKHFAAPTFTTSSFAANVVFLCGSEEMMNAFKADASWEKYADRFITAKNIIKNNWFVSDNGTLLAYTGDKTNIAIPKEVKSMTLYVLLNETTAAKVGTAVGKIESLTAEDGAGYVITNGALLSKDGTKLLLYTGSAETYTNATVTEVGDCAFYGNKTIQTVALNNLTTVGQYAFYQCSALTTVTASKLESIGNYGFYQCSALATISLNTLKTVGTYCFHTCTSLTGAISLDAIESLGQRAFQACSGITSVTIGANCTEIGSYAFLSCTQLLSESGVITIKAGTPPTVAANSFGTASSFKGTIKVPAAAVDTYKAATNWSGYAANIVAED